MGRLAQTVSEVLVATPLKYSAVTRAYTFTDGISIRELSPILWDVSIAKTFISIHERDELARTRYWLCASREVDRSYVRADDDLFDKAMYAMSALQIICPSGSKNIFLEFARTDKGYDNVRSWCPKELCGTLIGRITSLEDRRLEQDFEAVYSLVKRAFTEKIVRLQNPILFLEHGMQVGHIYLGALMFVMALDMLMMAGEKAAFVERVGGFVGPHSFVFPPDSLMNRQPAVKVQDVLADLYEFRSIVAHGQEIPKIPYRQKYNLIDDNGGQINLDDYYYAELMLESGLFLLTGVLRRISVDGLLDQMREEAKWRSNLRLYEHRWKNCAFAATQHRGKPHRPNRVPMPEEGENQQ
jgi:hypothetical protein